MRVIRDCSVCVVGGAGFLGSHLVDHLIEDRNCKVLVVDNLSSGFKKFIHPAAAFEHHDITGSEVHLNKLFRTYETRFVFNYAAHPYIPVSFERPLHVFDLNAMGALKVINAAWESGCEGILQVSSAEIYGKGSETSEPYTDGLKITEEGLVRPHSSYGAAKAAIDAMVQVRWKEAKVPVIALRQFNCIGPRETHPYVVPEIISQISQYKTRGPFCRACGGRGLEGDGQTDCAQCDGTGEQSNALLAQLPQSKISVNLGNNSFRDFQHARDAVRMATELLEKGQFGDVYNMGSETGVQIYDLAKLIGGIMEVDVKVVQDPSRVRPWEIWHLQSDNSKLYSVIESRSSIDLATALKDTVDYFTLNGNRWDWQ